MKKSCNLKPCKIFKYFKTIVNITIVKKLDNN